MKQKKITIHKANEVIRGTDDYSLYAKRCMNAIYFLYQHNINLGNKLYELPYINIEFPFLRKMMNLQKVESYITIIENSLMELEKTIELNNFYHPQEKIKYNWYTDRFLNKAGWYTINNKKYAKIEISSLAKYLMQKKVNFTEIDLIQYVNKFRTKYAMKLYEYLKSFKHYKYLDITDNHIRKLLNIEDIKKYQYFSTLKELVERQIKDIQLKSDLKELEMKVYKTTKTFKFIINKKATKKTPEKKQIDDAVKNIIKRF